MNDMIMSSTDEYLPVMKNLSDECSCQLKQTVECGTCDFSAVNKFPLAMAYVPMQKFENLYCEGKALCVGTLFKDLDFPFKGERAGDSR